MTIRIETRVTSVGKLEALLRGAVGPSVELARENASGERGIDASVLVALVGASGTALGVLLSGLLKIREQAKAGQIVLVGSSGRRIEVPVDTSPEMIKELVKRAQQLDVATILLDR